MGGLKIGGKDAVKTAKKAPAPRPDVRPVDVPTDWNDPYADPFPPADVTDPNLSASWLADMGLWAQQWIEEIAALARKLDRLTRKTQEPMLADHPSRPAAIEKAHAMDVQLRDLARDIAWHEAHCDRTWSALTPKQRRHADACAHWMTDPQALRLIGRSWTGIGAMETWPRYWKVRRAWFQGFAPLLVLDMKEAGLWAWKPMPDPPDPFGGELVHDARLAAELNERT
mgnify:CR=1 FL=1